MKRIVQNIKTLLSCCVGKRGLLVYFEIGSRQSKAEIPMGQKQQAAFQKRRKVCMKKGFARMKLNPNSDAERASFFRYTGHSAGKVRAYPF